MSDKTDRKYRITISFKKYPELLRHLKEEAKSRMVDENLAQMILITLIERYTKIPE